MIEKGPAPFAGAQAHHDLPKAFRKDSENAGLDIDDPAYGRWVGDEHQKWSWQFGEERRELFGENVEPTAEEILAKMNELRATVEIPMTTFYGIWDRTLSARGMPWIAEFTEGVVQAEQCSICGTRTRSPAPNMLARLDPGRGTQWPDMIGTGHVSWLFIGSRRFVEALRAEGMQVEVGGQIGFTPPAPKRLSLTDAPYYYWVDPHRHRAARMDYAASGFVGVRRCPSCLRQSYDIKASTSDESPRVFDYDASSGLDLFTTDMGMGFYCTERVLECARKYRLTNVAFWPVEQGPFAKPVKYWT